jgi:hypothetical protein
MSSKRYPEEFKIEAMKQIYTYRSSKELFWKRVSPTYFHEGVKPTIENRKARLCQYQYRQQRGRIQKNRKIDVCYPGYGILGYRLQSDTCASLHTSSYFLVAGDITAIIILYRVATWALYKCRNKAQFQFGHTEPPLPLASWRSRVRFLKRRNGHESKQNNCCLDLQLFPDG